MTDTYLIDTSALTRLIRRQTKPKWVQAVHSGVVGLCDPVRLEYLQAVGGRTQYYDADALFQDLFPQYVIPDSAWDAADTVQRRLAEKSWHQCASPVDLLVAVTAAHHKVTVLHADRDFETIARVTGQPTERIS